MRGMSTALAMLIACLAVSVTVIGVGIPLLYGWVPPNRQYGFRTPKTLTDPLAWYRANRVCGYWLIVTGVATAGTSAGLYAMGVEFGIALFFSLAALMCGVIVMAVQSDAAARHAKESVQLQFRLLALFVVTTLVAIGCAIARLPAPWILKVGLLWAYVICVIGLSIRTFKSQAPKPQ